MLSDCVWKPIRFDFKAVRTRFGTNFGSKLAGVFELKLSLEALPTPQWTPKAVWIPFETVQEAFWEHFSSIFELILDINLIKF